MSNGTQVYTGNGFERFFEHIGHDVAVVFTSGEKLVAKLPEFIKAAKDAGTDAEQLVPLVQNVITAAMAFVKPAASVLAAFGSGGTNLTADENAIGSVVAEAPALESDLQVFVSAVKALAIAIGADWEQLVADLTGTSSATTETASA